MSAPTLLVVAHGTRDPAGPPVLEGLVALAEQRLAEQRLADSAPDGAAAAPTAPTVPTALAYVDVIEPGLADVLQRLDGPAVLVPLFLAAGYHVRVDVPDVVAASGRTDLLVTDAVGPDPEVVTAVWERLLEAAGPNPPASVVLAAAGSSDARALADVAAAADRLGAISGLPVETGYASTASPTVPEAVERARRVHGGPVGVASYLIAPGLFQRRLDVAGGDVLGAPIGAHRRLADVLVARYRSALAAASRST